MALKQLEEFDINNLYKVLKRIDVETLKHYNDYSASDVDYFSYAMKNDIVSNALNIVINYLFGNIESCGVDMSCRTIIEALMILKMDENNEISDVQKKIYRYSYTYVDISNFFETMNLVSDKEKKVILDKLEKDKNNATQAMLTYFKCNMDELNKAYRKDDPCFYLQKNLNERIKPSKLLEKYAVCEECKGMYDFFSIFIHPNAEIDQEFKDKLLKKRKDYINKVLDCVFDYLKKEDLLLYDSDTSDFESDISKPQFYNNHHNIIEFFRLISILENKLCITSNGINWFNFQFLEKNKSLIIDMLISISLGYNEHVVSIFKSLIEEFSIYYTINSTQLEEFKYIWKTYWLSSRIQFKNFFEDNNSYFNLESELKDVYENFYKNKYNLKSYSKFYNDLERNNLYCVSKKNKNFTENVKKYIKSVFQNYNERTQDVFSLYKISKDMCHASGYSFNATAEVIAVSAHKTLQYAFEFLINFILNVSLTLNDRGVEFNGKPLIDYLSAMSNIHQEIIMKMYEEHKLKNT